MSRNWVYYIVSMKMHLEKSDRLLISSYSPGAIRVDNRDFDRMILLINSSVTECSFEGSAADLTIDLLTPLIEQRPDVMIFGSGEHHQFPPRQLAIELGKHGIALETMTTGAACRTYNVLVAEMRDVCAALLP